MLINLFKKGENLIRVNQKEKAGEKKVLDIKDSKIIFLKVIIEDCLKYMNIKGIPNIKEIRIPPPIPMLTTFIESEVVDQYSLDKFSSKPYNIKIDDFHRVWRIKIRNFLIKFLVFLFLKSLI